MNTNTAWANRLMIALRERDEARKQRDRLKRELQRVLDFFGRDEEKGLLPAGFATFNGAREAINEASNLNK